MVWPFSSSSSNGNKDTSVPTASSMSSSVQDTLEHAGQDAKALLQSTKTSLDEMTHNVEAMATTAASSTSFLSSKLPAIPAAAEPYIITSTVFGLVTAMGFFYRRRLRRIPSSAYLTPNTLQGKRILKGKVTSVGDSDNFRFYHTPGGVWAGWGWLRHVPKNSKELKNQTLHIRIAGVDAPEGAHFGMPAQPFSHESLEWLRKELLGKTVVVKPFSKDRYERVVSMAWYPRLLPFLPKKNVSVEMLKVGYGQIYRQAGSEYGGMLQEFEKVEANAKKHKIGIWSQKNMVSAAEHKKQNLFILLGDIKENAAPPSSLEKLERFKASTEKSQREEGVVDNGFEVAADFLKMQQQLSIAKQEMNTLHESMSGLERELTEVRELIAYNPIT
ncbi:putative endonuclease lcl3 [Gamsiella multidivaricata]|nr:putative endonuclease lcl3 [Gamsiella multidivaricata]